MRIFFIKKSYEEKMFLSKSYEGKIFSEKAMKIFL